MDHVDDDRELLVVLLEVFLDRGYVVLEQAKRHLCFGRGLMLTHGEQVAGLTALKDAAIEDIIVETHPRIAHVLALVEGEGVQINHGEELLRQIAAKEGQGFLLAAHHLKEKVIVWGAA